MKNIKGFALGFVLALGLAVAGAGFAQTTVKDDQTGKQESCCSMESCCCKGGSCSMKDGHKQHAQKENGKEHSHEGCCCCSGDSCQMKMKEKQKQG